MTKSDVSAVLSGFQNDEKGRGYEIVKVKGWDYPDLVSAYEKAEKLAREKHIPSIIHVVEMTQPTGHSTSGSHERYKSKERLQWEQDFDCIKKFKEWIIENGIATIEELETIDKESVNTVKKQKKEAWTEYQSPIKEEWKELLEIFNSIDAQLNIADIADWIQDLNQSAMFGIFRRDFLSKARTLLGIIVNEDIPEKATLRDFINRINPKNINKLQLEGLVKAGAFDTIFSNRKVLYNNIPNIIQNSKTVYENKLQNQTSLFSDENQKISYLLQDKN